MDSIPQQKPAPNVASASSSNPEPLTIYSETTDKKLSLITDSISTIKSSLDLIVTLIPVSQSDVSPIADDEDTVLSPLQQLMQLLKQLDQLLAQLSQPKQEENK